MFTRAVVGFSKRLSFGRGVVARMRPFRTPILAQFGLGDMGVLKLTTRWCVLSGLVDFVGRGSVCDAVHSGQRGHLHKGWWWGDLFRAVLWSTNNVVLMSRGPEYVPVRLGQFGYRDVEVLKLTILYGLVFGGFC